MRVFEIGGDEALDAQYKTFAEAFVTHRYIAFLFTLVQSRRINGQ